MVKRGGRTRGAWNHYVEPCETFTAEDSIILHVDLDCAQVQEEILHQKLYHLLDKDIPIVVAKENGGLLSVNYTALTLGIKRANEENRNVEELKEEYPHLIVINPLKRFGREDTFPKDKYHNEVLKAVLQYKNTLKYPDSIKVDRDSSDAMYIDVTKLVRQRCGLNVVNLPFQSRLDALVSTTKNHPNPHYDGNKVTIMVGPHEDLFGEYLRGRIFEWKDYGDAVNMQLVHGAAIANAILNVIKEKTKLQASAGVANSKLLARIACRMFKPQSVTAVNAEAICRVPDRFKIQEIHGYGLKSRLGLELAKYGLCTFKDIQEEHGDALTNCLIHAFEQLNVRRSPQAEAQKLKRFAYGRDDKNVTDDMLKKRIELTMPTRGETCYGPFKNNILNLTKDLATRLSYYRQNWNYSPKKVGATIIFNTGKCAHPLNVGTRCDYASLHSQILNYINHENMNGRLHEISKVLVWAQF